MDITHNLAFPSATDGLTLEGLTALFGAAAMGVYLLQAGSFRFANVQFQRGTGYTLDELSAMDGLSLVHPDDQAGVQWNATGMLKGLRWHPYEFRFLTKNGEVRWVVGSVTPVSFEGQRATLGYYFDVTERKRAEEWVRRQEAERARLDALQEAAMAMVHHVLNAVAPIVGHAELFDGRDLQKAQALQRVAIRHGRQIEAIVRVFDDLARSGETPSVIESLGPGSQRMLDLEARILRYLSEHYGE